MPQIVNGRIVEVQTEANGTVRSEDIRRAAGIPRDRPLVLQSPDGSNRIINPGENVTVGPNEYFKDIPPHRRGGLGSTFTGVQLRYSDRANQTLTQP